MKAVLSFVGVTLVYLVDKFLDAPIGEAAQVAWTAIKRLVGL
jgi:hypothetical protein